MKTIAESLLALNQAKTDIAEAIITKGGTVNEGDGFADFAADIMTITGELDPYEGDYTITPKANQDQILETSGKSMTGNLKVLKIQYAEVANPAGGTTFSIDS